MFHAIVGGAFVSFGAAVPCRIFVGRIDRLANQPLRIHESLSHDRKQWDYREHPKWEGVGVRESLMSAGYRSSRLLKRSMRRDMCHFMCHGHQGPQLLKILHFRT